VKKPASDEFERIERFIFKLSVRAVAIAQHDAPALVIAEQPAFAEGTWRRYSALLRPRSALESTKTT
jgi:hypothetical protein